VGNDVRVKTGDGAEMAALFSAASLTPAPGILVLHEIFGMTDFIRSRLPLFNAQGYTAMAPDLYHRINPGVSYDYAGADWERAFATRDSLDDDLAVEDIGFAVEALAARPECNGEVVVVGYCLGGLLALLTGHCEKRDIPYRGLPVGTVKKFATGRGNASKNDMMAHASTKFGGPVRSHDQADALWILSLGLKELGVK